MPSRKPKEETPAEVRKQVEKLKHLKWNTKMSATRALGAIGREIAVSHLARALQDMNLGVRLNVAAAFGEIGRSFQGKEVNRKEARALQLVAEHFHEREEPEVLLKAYRAALKGKVTEKNARLYVKQLRAMRGSLK